MAYDFGTYKGYVAENFVAQELKSSRPSASLFSWTENQAEIEFLIQGDAGAIPIEVKSASRVRSQSLKAFMEKYKPEVSIIASGRPFSKVSEKGTGCGFIRYLRALACLRVPIKSLKCATVRNKPTLSIGAGHAKCVSGHRALCRTRLRVDRFRQSE